MIRLALLATAFSLATTGGAALAQSCTNAIGCVAPPAATTPPTAPSSGMFGVYNAYSPSVTADITANPYMTESLFDSMGNLRSKAAPAPDAAPVTTPEPTPGVPAKLADPPMASDPKAPQLKAIEQGPD